MRIDRHGFSRLTSAAPAFAPAMTCGLPSSRGSSARTASAGGGRCRVLAPLLLSGNRASPRSKSIHSQRSPSDFAEARAGEHQELDRGDAVRRAVIGCERVSEPRQFGRRQEALALRLGELLDMAARIRTVRPQAPPLGEVEHLGQHREHAVRLVGRRADWHDEASSTSARVTSATLRLPSAGRMILSSSRRYSPAVDALRFASACSARNRSAEFGNCRRSRTRAPVRCGIGPALDHPEQPLGLAACRLCRPGRAVATDRQLAQGAPRPLPARYWRT